MSQEKALVGATGEHYIAFQLSRRGHAVGFTARATRGADLLVTNLKSKKSATIQVKTGSEAFRLSKKWGSYWKWPIGISRPKPGPTFYYLFVDLKGNVSKLPDVFIVRSLDLESAPLDAEADEVGLTRGEFPRAAFCFIYDRGKDLYLNRWDVIEAALS